MPTLILEFPEGASTAYPVAGARVSIGRHLRNDITIGDPHISSFHAELRQVEGDVYDLVDLDSHNGTAVNGSRIEQCRLKDGDKVMFAIVEAKFRTAFAEETRTLPPEKLNLMRSIDPDILRTTDEIQLHPELARAAATLQKQIEQAKSSIRKREPSQQVPIERHREDMLAHELRLKAAEKELGRLKNESVQVRQDLQRQVEELADQLQRARAQAETARRESERHLQALREAKARLAHNLQPEPVRPAPAVSSKPDVPAPPTGVPKPARLVPPPSIAGPSAGSAKPNGSGYPAAIPLKRDPNGAPGIPRPQPTQTLQPRPAPTVPGAPPRPSLRTPVLGAKPPAPRKPGDVDAFKPGQGALKPPKPAPMNGENGKAGD